MPWSRNDAFIATDACWSSSAGEGADAQPASEAANKVATTRRKIFMFAVRIQIQRLIDGAIDSAPLALTPMNTPTATVASEPKPGYGKRC